MPLNFGSIASFLIVDGKLEHFLVWRQLLKWLSIKSCLNTKLAGLFPRQTSIAYARANIQQSSLPV